MRLAPFPRGFSRIQKVLWGCYPKTDQPLIYEMGPRGKLLRGSVKPIWGHSKLNFWLPGLPDSPSNKSRKIPGKLNIVPFGGK